MCEYYGYVGSERNGYPTARSGACVAGGIVGYADDQGAEWLLSSMILLPFGVVINPLLLYAGTEHGTVTRQGIYNCISRGIVATAGGDTSGILGWGNTGEALRHTLIVKNCFHEGKVDPNGGGKAGGIVGRAYKFDIKNCYYRGCDQGFVVDIGGSMDSEEAYSYETLGMTKAEVAEKLGSCFLYVNDDIQLNFVPTDSSEPVTETTEPAAETTEPAAEMTEPAAETTEPAAETTEPAAETTEPVTEAPTEPQKPLAPVLACYPTTYEEKPVVMLKWNMIDGIAGYEYQISADPDFAGSQPYTVENTYNSVSLNNNATPGTTYYLRVRTYLETENGRLYSDYANIQFTAPVLAENAELAAPVMKTAVLNNDNKFTIYWGKVEGADSYEIDTATDPAFENCLRNDTEKATALQTESRYLIGFNKDQVYYYRVRAVKESENGNIYSDYAYINLVIPASFTLIYGDADGSRSVDASDAASLLIDAALVGSGEKSALTDTQRMAADVNSDNSVDATDAAAILMYAAAVGAGQSDAKITDFI